MWKKIICGLAAMGVATAPVLASANGVERASQPASESSELGGASLLSLVVMAAVIGGGIWLAVDDDDDEPVSA
ncbi:MAG: hypothetical protein ACQKBV_05475 [Puniceicoccales bacterium]|uniref:hypothetical protein n=1 Tax=Croceicoccus sp. Ery15 TaxID=1703338 RepID=UPI001E3FE8FE|nr:hypothetical protein [Croceicoccus sp. Ery15]